MRLTLDAFCHEIKFDSSFVGDILEFGTGSGISAGHLNNWLMGSKRIFTFDGFRGLPKTSKVLPEGSSWEEGNCYYDEETTKNSLKQFPNIIVTKTMTFDLKSPAAYGISRIAGANLDLDLYEGTVDALNFIDQCEWNHLLLRFDDWGAYYFQSQEEVAQHEQAAFFEYVNDKKYQYSFYEKYNEIAGHLDILVRLAR